MKTYALPYVVLGRLAWNARDPRWLHWTARLITVSALQVAYDQAKVKEAVR